MMTLNSPHVYEIRVEGLLPEDWSQWFEGLKIKHICENKTILKGALADQAALIGVLNKIHGLHLDLLSIMRL